MKLYRRITTRPCAHTVEALASCFLFTCCVWQADLDFPSLMEEIRRMGWEIYTHDIADCPCGQGKIVREHHSPDNPWSSSHESVEISCTICEKSWQVSYGGSELVERASRDASREAEKAYEKSMNSISDYLNSILSEYPLPSFKTQKEEFAYLTQAGLYDGKIGQYRYARRDAEMADIAVVRIDSLIVPKLIGKVGNADSYNALLLQSQAAKKNAADKALAVKTIKIPSK